ncbi:MAG: tetratricopeptide repeat protein [bacterium]|nr:tetratricopeptide repeat protein [bacterium]
MAQTSLEEIFAKSNELYQEGNYTEAAKGYEEIINRGMKTPVLFYNLGNAYFRDKNLGRAILNYERAARLSPRDDDIRFNLEFARALIHEPEEHWLDRLLNLFSIHELILFTTLFYWLLMFGLILYLFRRGTLWLRLNLAIAVIFLLSGLCLGTKIYSEQADKPAVILEKTAARNGPGEDYSVGFSLPEGKRVVILNQREEWREVGLPKEGLKGWVKDGVMEEI